MYEPFEFDEDGIPRYPYRGALHYNITFICHYALYQLSLYQKFARAEPLQRFLQVSRWIAENGEETPDSFTFPYRFDIPGLDAPWISALGQGRMLSVLTRAAEAGHEGSRSAKTGHAERKHGRHDFLALARKAVRPFEVPVGEGGIRTNFDDGGIAFEEYPRRQRNVVLNGLITSLFGLYDLAATGDEQAAGLFDRAATALARNLKHYDLGYWSAYDLTGPIRRVAGDDYHAYHVMLLWALHEITGFEVFRQTADRWDGYGRGARLHFFRTLSRINTKVRYR